eukprot:3294945-Amphidinium_carterae.1
MMKIMTFYVVGYAIASCVSPHQFSLHSSVQLFWQREISTFRHVSPWNCPWSRSRNVPYQVHMPEHVRCHTQEDCEDSMRGEEGLEKTWCSIQHQSQEAHEGHAEIVPRSQGSINSAGSHHYHMRPLQDSFPIRRVHLEIR